MKEIKTEAIKLKNLTNVFDKVTESHIGKLKTLDQHNDETFKAINSANTQDIDIN